MVASVLLGSRAVRCRRSVRPARGSPPTAPRSVRPRAPTRATTSAVGRWLGGAAIVAASAALDRPLRDAAAATRHARRTRWRGTRPIRPRALSAARARHCLAPAAPHRAIERPPMRRCASGSAIWPRTRWRACSSRPWAAIDRRTAAAHGGSNRSATAPATGTRSRRRTRSTPSQSPPPSRWKPITPRSPSGRTRLPRWSARNASTRARTGPATWSSSTALGIGVSTATVRWLRRHGVPGVLRPVGR